jgi:hypothetical protein
MLTAEMNVIYWEFQQDRQKTSDTFMRTFLALASSGTFATLWVLQSHPEVQKTIAAVAGFASIIYAITFPSDKLPKIAGLVAAWKEISRQYRILWARNKEISDEKVWEEFERISNRPIDESVLRRSMPLLKKAYRQVCLARNLEPGDRK